MPLTVDDQLLEHMEHDADIFPLTYFEHEFSTLPDRKISLHWHPEFELISSVSHCFDIQVGQEHLTLAPGEIILVNGNIMHAMRQISGENPDPMPNIVFSGSLIAPETSAVYQKYIFPVASCGALPFILLDQSFMEVFHMEFHWLNESKMEKKGDRIEITAPPQTDFFCGNADKCEEGILPETLCNAPYYYTEVEGDFVLKVKVSHAFKDTYDSASVMVMKDMNCWAKCCYELTDFGTHAAVSVVTKGDSDDANGCNLEGNTAWLQVCRVGSNFAFHYSVDGENFYMMRYFHLPADPVIKVGLLAQAPTGGGGIRIYENLSIEKKTVRNIRAGK